MAPEQEGGLSDLIGDGQQSSKSIADEATLPRPPRTRPEAVISCSFLAVLLVKYPCTSRLIFAFSTVFFERSYLQQYPSCLLTLTLIKNNSCNYNDDVDKCRMNGTKGRGTIGYE